MTDFGPEMPIAIDAVRQAIDLAARGTGEIHLKVGRDIVTDTDVAVEDHLRRSLTDAFGFPVVGEERGGQPISGSPYWLVDPICGTRNFASGIPLFAVNVALVVDGVVAMSVCGDGSSGEVLAAEAGGGAWRVCGLGFEPLSASASNLIVDFGGWPKAGRHREKAGTFLARAVESDCWDVRCLSTTLSLAYVATGQIAGCVLFSTPDAVHSAAGSLLVAEAGGQVTDESGVRWNPSSRCLVSAGSEELHHEILKLLHAATFSP